MMTLKDLKDSLQAPYKLENWQNILREVLGKPIFLTKDAYQPLFEETDFVEKAFQFGSYDLPKNRKIAIVDVKLKDEKTPRIADTKVKLRELAAKLVGLTNSEGHQFVGVLAFFHSTHQKNYRLSFIARAAEYNAEIDDFVNVETANKRFTYILGESESCTTAAKQLVSLIEKAQVQTIELNDIKEAFNVDKLNKEFFKGYKEHYEKFWKYINNQPNYREKLIDNEQIIQDKAEKPIRDFAKKLLGRIVFLYFLQKKGWMGVPADRSDWQGGDPNFIKNLFQNTTDKSKFYSTNLIELFYNTLNQVRENDIFHLTATKVPYLNGGLFDNDSIETNHFDFPESYFSELFDFFEQFNFTIDENSPDDANVGIDPEMLGHIFENLLEENKDKGAFYTPKEVVQFMCQEALIQYLKPHFLETAQLDNFVRGKEISIELKNRKNALKLNELLDKVRICDPAIGSGAFPIGILQEIFEAKRFIFPYLNANTFNAAEVKLRIIEHSIYGVDMDKGAVDIARLRFWLALVVDEDIPRPLPNLDYKIMQGDSLFDTFEGVDLSKIGTDDDNEVVLFEKPQLDIFGSPKQTLLVFDKASKEDLTQLIHDYFDPQKNNLSKANIRQKIDEKITKKIHTRFELEKLDLKVNIEKQEKHWKEHGVWGKLNEKSKEFKKYKDQKDLYESFDLREQRVTELQKKPNEKPYFLWRLFFREVFEAGGFDIVLGNPPYFSVSKQPQLKPLADKYKTYESTGDIYALFYERGHQLLRAGGVLVYITGSSWLRSNYGTSLRKFFREQTDPLKLIDLSDCQIFESATVLTTIMAYRKAKNTNQFDALRLTRRTQYAIKYLPYYFEQNHIRLTNQPDTAWVILDRTRYDLKQQIEAQGKKLKAWGIYINRGVLTGFNNAFVLESTAEKDALVSKDAKNEELIKPLLRGRDVSRYSFDFHGKWLINVHNGVREKKIKRINVVDDYPTIFEHLKKYKSELVARNDQGDHWTNLRNCAYIEDFEKPKIIYPNMVKDISFAYDDKGFYANDKCFIMTGEKLKYLLGVLNSKLFRYAFEENFPELQGNSREIKAFVINEIPIKIPSEIEENNISILADYLLLLYDASNEQRVNPYADNRQVAGFFEDIMNHLVCELYFAQEMQEQGIAMNNIIEIESIEGQQPPKQKEIIGEVFKKLQMPGSKVRKCIAMASIKLPNTIGQILSRTV